MFFLKLISFKNFTCGSNLMIEVSEPNQFPKMIVNCHAMSRLIYNDITFELWKLMLSTANAKNIISNFFLLMKYTVQALCGFSKRSFMYECAYLL